MIIRTVLLILALINNILSLCGYPILPIDDELAETFVTSTFTVVTTIINWWKNNSVTKEAKEADAYLKDLKETK